MWNTLTYYCLTVKRVCPYDLWNINELAALVFIINIDEYTGSIAKSQLEITNFMVNLGKLVQPIIKVGASIIEHLVKPFNELFKKSLEKPSEELLKLTMRMEELKNITKPTREEQKELQTVMNQIALLAPQAVTAYDDMGNAQVNFAATTK